MAIAPTDSNGMDVDDEPESTTPSSDSIAANQNLSNAPPLESPSAVSAPSTQPAPILEPSPNGNPEPIATAMSVSVSATSSPTKPKRRKKRTRNEMEIDSTPQQLKSTNSEAIKRRKLCDGPTPIIAKLIANIPIKSTVPKAPSTASNTSSTSSNNIDAKWQRKHTEYAARIVDHFKALRAHFKSSSQSQALLAASATQSELSAFQEQLAALPSSDSSESNSDSNKSALDTLCTANLGLISKLAHDRCEGLTALSTHVHATLNTPHLDVAAVRNLIGRSAERKVYGIRPLSKSINKAEELAASDEEVSSATFSWKRCRLYRWECMAATYAYEIPKEFRADEKPLRTRAAAITKHGAFCKKFESVTHRACKLKKAAKEEALQKLEDIIVAWQGKQDQLERARVLKEEAARKKREERERERERKAKEKEMERERREQVKKEARERAERLKREAKEKRERERAEKERERAEKAKAKLEAKERAEREKAERLAEKARLKAEKALKLQAKKTPKKRKYSLLDNWVRVTKFEDTTDATNSPIIKDKIVCTTSDKSPTMLDDTVSLYHRLFIPFKFKDDYVYAPLHAYLRSGSDGLQIEIDSRIEIGENGVFRVSKRPLPRATAIPLVHIQTDTAEEKESAKAREMSIDGLVGKMQIDDNADAEPKSKSEPNSAKSENLTLRWKCRFFEEDNRPSFFGVNRSDRAQHKLTPSQLRKACRSPFTRAIPLPTVHYDDDDSGVEWYDDIDDLENGEDLVTDDEDADTSAVRADGFERDGFVMNSDDDDEEARDDQAMMRSMERAKRRERELKDEYPSDLTFVGRRQRGDAEDAPILVRLPRLKAMAEEHGRLFVLMRKKAVMVSGEEMGVVEHDAVKDNDLDVLVAKESFDDAEAKEERERKERKAKKAERKAKKAEKRAKKAEEGGVAGIEDGDVEMGGVKTPKTTPKKKKKPTPTKQLTLGAFFKKSPNAKKAESKVEVLALATGIENKENVDSVEAKEEGNAAVQKMDKMEVEVEEECAKVAVGMKVVEKIDKPIEEKEKTQAKKKKRRRVVCELIE